MNDKAVKLHIGSGTQPIAGWINIDIADGVGVDRIIDVRKGLPFSSVAFIFAEHFLEHLTLLEGLSFLRECRRVIDRDGVLRLSTPNLDWVWLTHYKTPTELQGDEPILGCLELNRAFHGWGHKFLYNGRLLAAALRNAGFSSVEPRSYGVSAIPDLSGLERHELHDSARGLPSVIVVEASGTADTTDESFAAMIAPYTLDMAIS